MQAVPEHHVVAVLPHLSAQLRTVVELLRLTGARPSEILALRPREIDLEGVKVDGVTCWIIAPGRHKTDWKEVPRAIVVGPAGQGVLRPFLDRDGDAYCFSPAEAEQVRNATRRAKRKSKRWPSHVRHQQRKRKATPKRAPRDHYTSDSLRRAISRACETAGVPRWFPYQLRHLAAQRFQRGFGRAVAAEILGHRDQRTTEHYLGLDLEGAARVMARVG